MTVVDGGGRVISYRIVGHARSLSNRPSWARPWRPSCPNPARWQSGATSARRSNGDGREVAVPGEMVPACRPREVRGVEVDDVHRRVAHGAVGVAPAGEIGNG